MLYIFFITPFLPVYIIDVISHILTYKYVESGYLFACLCLVSMSLLSRKHMRNAILTTSIATFPTTPTQTLIKKPQIAALSMPIKGKAVTFIYKAMAKSSRLVPLNSRSSQVEFPTFD